MSTAFIFPGQGSQFIGMGKDLAEKYEEARLVFEEVDNALDQKLSTLMFEGEMEDLNLTENTQPALMAVSMAVIRILEGQGKLNMPQELSFVAGHSLGEYAALTAAGSLELSDTARLLKLRGQAMQRAVPVGVGAMAAILGLDFDDVKEITKEASGDEKVEAANDNSTGQVVVSGHAGAVARAVELATEKGAKKAVTLPVSAPFHCTLMAPAAQEMARALADTDIRPPHVPVVANVTAQAVTEPSQIRQLLIEQITGTVRWRESVMLLKEQGVDQAFEIGAGKVLSGLVKRIDREIATTCVGTAEQVEAFLENR